MPDPTDGSLYYFDKDPDPLLNEPRLKRMTYTIPEMIETSPTRSSEGFLYTGDKKDRWQIINPVDGEVLQKVDQKVRFLGHAFIHLPIVFGYFKILKSIPISIPYNILYKFIF